MSRFSFLALFTTTALSAGTSVALDAAAYGPPIYSIHEEITVRVEDSDVMKSKMWALILK